MLHNAVLSELQPRLPPRLCFVLNTVAKGFSQHPDSLKIGYMSPHFEDTAMDDIDACVLSGSVKRQLMAEAIGFVPHGPLAMHLAAFTRNVDVQNAIMREMRVPAPIEDSRVIDIFAAQADKDRVEWALRQGAPRDDKSLLAAARSGDQAIVRAMMSNGYRVSPDLVDNSVASGNGRLVKELILFEGAEFDTDATMIAMATRRHNLLRMLADFDRGQGRIEDSRVIGLAMHIATSEPPIWGLLHDGGAIRVRNHAPDNEDPPGFYTEDYDTPAELLSDTSDDEWE